MPEKTPKTSKEWAKGQKEFCASNAEDETQDLLANLEEIRLSLGMHPQAFSMIVEQILATPYCKSNDVVDGFIALQILRIFAEFANRLKRIGITDMDDPHLKLNKVDLSAAKESCGIDLPDDAAIRKSFLDNDGQSGRSDEDVARSAGGADDTKIRTSADIPGIDKVVDEIEAAEVSAQLARIGGKTNADGSAAENNDANSGSSGAERVQLGMLDIEGTPQDPILCARATSKILFEAVLNGFNGTDGGRPGLTERIQPLSEYGEVNMESVRAELKRILVEVRSATFRSIGI